MFDPSKIIFGFDDLGISPRIKTSDRRVVADRENLRQKNGKSRFLITINNPNDLADAVVDKENYYIAKFNNVDALIKTMIEPEFDNIIPQIKSRELIANKGLIMSNLVESKDKFNVIIDIGDDIGSLYDMLSMDNANFVSMFNAIYRVYANETTIGMINDMKAIGVIVDRSIGGIRIDTSASCINKCFRALSSMYGNDAIKYTDLLEGPKNNYIRVISDYDENDPYVIKSIALGSQFFILDMPIAKAKEKINIVEEMWMKYLTFINTSDFNDIFRYVDCGLVSK